MVIVDVASNRLTQVDSVRCTAAKTRHLSLNLLLQLLDARILNQFKLGLELLVLLLELVEIGRLVGASLQEPNDIVINCAQLVIVQTLVALRWLRLV